jgi:hypothetical protein
MLPSAAFTAQHITGFGASRDAPHYEYLSHTETPEDALWQYGMMRFGTALGGSLNFGKNCRLRFFKHITIKEPSASVLWKQFQNQRIFSFGFFKNLNGTDGFMKESTKNLWVFGRFFNLFCIKFWELELCAKINYFENWQGSKYIDKMITSSTRPSFKEPFNEHWFGPILVRPYTSIEPQTQFQNLHVYIYSYIHQFFILLFFFYI